MPPDPNQRNATDNCYVDQPSVCDEPNAVSCTNLAKGVTKACCPRLTTCSNETAATKEYVRCNIQFADLRRIDQAESSSSSSSLSSAAASSSATPTSSSTPGQSTPTATTTGLAVLTTTAAIQTPLPPTADSRQGQASSQSPASLPGGLIGGAAVGATLGFVSLVLLGYLFFQKQAKKKRRQQQQQEEGAGSTAYPQPQPPLEYSHSQHSHHQGVAQKGYGQFDHSSQAKREIEYGYQPGVWSGPPVEVDGDTAARKWEPVELPSERWK
ncbi:hypothetical protein NEMBOFW57_000716 [Staphylotrichum longicolle]|uniref:Uncharacterized protein n=1 Tax=Staphylotrichum longicolle TaxID=669026 RepID=A0AAD4EZV6_9PEZI|nr:hypothetical protein NEMBOFW57_000716 [Staphylotrichum longicolle]